MAGKPDDAPGRRAVRLAAGRLAQLRTRLAGALEGVFDSRPLWSAFFLVVLTPLVAWTGAGPSLPVPEPGSVVEDDVLAPRTREYVDDEATREVRQAARDATPPVYDVDLGVAARSVDLVHQAFQEWRRVRDSVDRGRGAVVGLDEMTRALRGTAAPPAPPEAMRHLLGSRFDPAVEQRLTTALHEVLRQRISGSRAFMPRSGRVTLRDAQSGREWKEDAPHDIVPLEDARRLALAALARAGSPPREVTAVGGFVQDLVTPTLAFNGALTEARRRDAAARVEPLIVRIPKGKVLLRRGEVVTGEAARTLAAFNAASDPAGRWALLGHLLFLSLLLFFLARYVFFYQQAHRKERHLFALMVVVIALSLVIDRGFLWLYENVVDTMQGAPFTDPADYRFMIPVAAGAMLITLLANPRVGMAYALFSVPLFGMMMEWDLRLTLFCLISNLAGIYGITTYRRRTAPIKAGLALGAMNAAAVLALQAVPAPGPVPHLPYAMACAFMGGILVAVVVSFLLPLMEAMFSILTDVRLLELSNLNNPLLRRLAVEAPGSYNHSVIVGTLAEAAAEAIGANALFCRVAAYYHDVGKLLKPDYFVENQKDGVNRHDRLSPRMSAIVIASHVKEGYELGRTYGLPKQVLDIIPQHHGTRKINYFYQKAKREEDPESDEVQESDFRYPGPKPQSKEAVIFMLSDSIEAAARTLEDPSPSRFKGLIRRIVSDVVLDDQFDQSDLTFAELEKVCGSFLSTLSSIYHHRIDYPGFDFEKTPERPFRGSRSHEAPPPATRWGR